MSGLDEEALRAALGDAPWLERLDVAAVVDSTNDELRRRRVPGAGAAALVADAQTAGRGRRGRRWLSPAGLGLYVSVAIPEPGPAALAPRWTLAASVAACEACRAAAGDRVAIDWPNDLVCGRRKLGGILAELRTVGGRSELIVGAGINVHHEARDLAAIADRPATSLRLETAGREPERMLLAADYLRRLGDVAAVLRADGWPALAGRWCELAPGARGRRVTVRGGDGAEGVVGVTDGLAADGALRVRLDGGGVREVRLAESVRPVGEE